MLRNVFSFKIPSELLCPKSFGAFEKRKTGLAQDWVQNWLKIGIGIHGFFSCIVVYNQRGAAVLVFPSEDRTVTTQPCCVVSLDNAQCTMPFSPPPLPNVQCLSLQQSVEFRPNLLFFLDSESDPIYELPTFARPGKSICEPVFSFTYF